MTTRELQDALTELHLANEQLEASKRALELERDKLRQDQKGLKQELTKQVKIANEVYRTRAKLSAIDQSQKLSQQAQKLLQSKNPTNQQYKEAFQLARYAWGLSKNNSQAMDVLNKINNDKLKNSGNGGFLSGDRPKNTYTYSNIERIIKKIDDRYNYGKISETEAKRLLR
jgi:regulator of replication initiation timing